MTLEQETLAIIVTFLTAFLTYGNFTTILYMQYEYFPTDILGFVLGSANGTARIVSIFTPFFIETIPQPFVCLVVLSIAGAILSTMLVEKHKSP